MKTLRKPMSKKKPTPDPLEFAKTWNSSDSAAEVAEKLGMTREQAHARASYYRKQGVNLKAMPRKAVTDLDVDAINRELEKNDQ